MKSNELRIGNLVDNSKNGYPIFKVTSIDEEGIEVWALDYNDVQSTYNMNELNPIPLSEEWLLKFGFSTDNITFKIRHNGYRIVLFQINRANKYNDNENEFTITVYQSKQSIEICRVKHVHQLQNLYFALTGEELTLKEQ